MPKPVHLAGQELKQMRFVYPFLCVSFYVLNDCGCFVSAILMQLLVCILYETCLTAGTHALCQHDLHLHNLSVTHTRVQI